MRLVSISLLNPFANPTLLPVEDLLLARLVKPFLFFLIAHLFNFFLCHQVFRPGSVQLKVALQHCIDCGRWNAGTTCDQKELKIMEN